MKKIKDWKLEALHYEYDPISGVEDTYWDKNFTKDMIRADIAWLIAEVRRLEKELKETQHNLANLKK